MFPVLFVKASAPASVASVPVVGNVTPVAAVIVKVLANAPAVVRFPPSVIVPVLLTPVPPFAAGRMPVTPVVSGNPVHEVNVPDCGVPRRGVTNVGEVANTAAPDPVSSVKAAARLALEGVPSHVDTPEPSPVMLARGNPVQFVKRPLVGVPST